MRELLCGISRLVVIATVSLIASYVVAKLTWQEYDLKARYELADSMYRTGNLKLAYRQSELALQAFEQMSLPSTDACSIAVQTHDLAHAIRLDTLEEDLRTAVNNDDAAEAMRLLLQELRLSSQRLAVTTKYSYSFYEVRSYPTRNLTEMLEILLGRGASGLGQHLNEPRPSR